LDPTDIPENNLTFLILMTAILKAIHDHSALLRASIGSAANDHRLGGHEAPPAIISVYLGEELETVLQNIEEKGIHKRTSKKNSYDLGALAAPDFTKENTDRNRTSPFAFTGNKFEFRAVGSSASPSFPMTVLNAIVAESLNGMLDEIERILEKSSTKKDLVEVVLPIVRKYLKASRNIRFAGDNYSQAWSKEAKLRGLPVIEKSIDAFKALKAPKTAHAFQGILNEHELHSRYEILAETYSHAVNIETRLMLDMARSQILPAAIQQQKDLAKSLAAFLAVVGPKEKPRGQISLLHSLNGSIENLIAAIDTLSAAQEEASAISSLEKRGDAFCYKVLPACEALRDIVDHLETMTNDNLWPLPKYREILFIT
jgi:glutamine synthetase